jgi:hypothetical protein
MNTLTFIIIGLLILLVVAVFTVLLPVAFIFNFKTGMAYRERLAGQIDKLRVLIRDQMTRCKACENTDTCDEKLEQKDISADSIDFCNNEKSLQELTKSLK